MHGLGLQWGVGFHYKRRGRAARDPADPRAVCLGRPAPATMSAPVFLDLNFSRRFFYIYDGDFYLEWTVTKKITICRQNQLQRGRDPPTAVADETIYTRVGPSRSRVIIPVPMTTDFSLGCASLVP